jgi:hypothetical protein
MGMRTLRRIGAGLLMAAISAAVCEGALRLAARSVPFVKYQLDSPRNRTRIPDALLGSRMSPYFPGHDRYGYRNDDRLDQYDTVAVGDSSTYGFGAMPSESWPRQLSRVTKGSVYNAGVGGYGPCEYRGVVDEILRRRCLASERPARRVHERL